MTPCSSTVACKIFVFCFLFCGLGCCAEDMNNVIGFRVERRMVWVWVFCSCLGIGVGAGRSGAGIGLFPNPPRTLRVENFQPVTRAEGTASAWVRVLRGGVDRGGFCGLCG
jgi:hypothetical protein